MLIDSHCHLDAAEFDADRRPVLAAAHAAGVAMIVVPAIREHNFAAVRALGRDDPGCVHALGLHPMYVEDAPESELDALRGAVAAAIDDPRLVAIGEIGLDHFVPGLDRARQEHFFVEQLRIARDFDLPVILHVRRAQDAVLKQLRRFRPRSGIAHAFNGSLQQATQFIELGCALGFGGAMTFTRAQQIRRLAAELPDEAAVLETDSPDIAPAWLHPGRNDPAQLPRIAATLAELRGTTPDRIAAVTTSNVARVLPRLAALITGG